MKKNLVTILALSAIALSVGACDKNKKPSGPEEYDLSMTEVFSYDTDSKTYEYQDKNVTIKEVCVYGNFGNTYICGVAYDQAESILDFKGIEVELSERPAWEGVTKGRYANVDLQGKLVNVDGRPVLKEASLKINAEAQYDEETGERIDGDGAFSAGYWGPDVFVREYYDEYMGRDMSGTLIEGIFQLASKPGEITAGSPDSFYVVFPGEDLDVEDVENYSLIQVDIPSLDEDMATKANQIFANYEVGDFVDMMGITRWESGSMGLIYDNWWGKYAADPEADQIPDIYANWADLSADVSPIYNEAIIDLAAADEEDALGAPFSLVVDASMFNKDPRDLWIDAYKDVLVRVADVDRSGTVKITANVKANKWESYVNAVAEKCEALGYEAESHASDGWIIFLHKTGNVVDKQLLLMAAGEQAVSLYYTALRLIQDEDFANVALASAAYSMRVSENVVGASWTTALPAVTNEAIANVNFSWKYEMYYAQQYNFPAFEYDFEISFAEGVTAEQKAALVAAYKSAVEGAGFVEAYQGDLGAQGLWKASTGEFVASLGLNKNGNLEIDVLVLCGDAASGVALKPQSAADMLAMINGEYAGWNSASATYFPTTVSSVTSFALGELAPVEFGFLDTTYNSFKQATGYTPFFVASIIYERDLTAEDVALFVAQLTAAGFVAATHAAFGAGYWKASTYEFIAVSFEGKTLNVGFGLVCSQMTSVVTVAQA